jgi:hypothetical protein
MEVNLIQYVNVDLQCYCGLYSKNSLPITEDDVMRVLCPQCFRTWRVVLPPEAGRKLGPFQPKFITETHEEINKETGS